MRLLLLVALPLAVVAAADSPFAAEPGPPGVCIVAGCDDPAAVAGLGARWVVHALDPDAARIAAVRAADDEGRVAAETWSGPRLPHVDRLAECVIADGRLAVPEAELHRVLAPGGTLWLRRDGRWSASVEPRPAGFDQWSHANHGADGNPVSTDAVAGVPEALHWVADRPRGFGSYASRMAGGRYIHCFDVYTGTTELQPRSNNAARRISGVEVVARSAANGVLLWRAEFPGDTRAQPVLDDERLYLPVDGQLAVIDAATGSIRTRIATPGIPCDCVRVADLLVVRAAEALVAYDARSGAERWRAPLPAIAAHVGALPKANFMVNQRFQLVIADGQRAYCTATASGGGKPAPVVAAVSLADGAVAWTSGEDALGKNAYPAFVAAGTLVLTSDRGVVGCDAATGAARWTTGDKVALMFGRGRYFSPNCLLAKDGLIWNDLERRRAYKPNPKLSEAENAQQAAAEAQKPVKGWRGLDPATGEERRRVVYDAPEGWLARCYPDIGLGRFLVSWAMEYVDTAADSKQQYRLSRGVCGSGFVVGDGRLYVPPTPCLYCFPMIRGASSYGAAPQGETAIADDQRLERGPAYGAPAGDEAGPDDWPMYRHDAARSGATSAAIDPAALALAWTTPAGGRCAQPVAAGDAVVAVDIARRRVTCRDAATGAERWRYVTAARIDSAPTLHRGLVLFGCHDGAIHALRLADGALAWRWRGAPSERRIAAYEQIESAWPIIGAVTVHQDLVFGIAGRLTNADGGMWLCALDPLTGAVRYRNHLTGVGGERAVLKPVPWHTRVDHLVNNLLVADGDTLSLHDQYTAWRFRCADGALIDKPTEERLRWRGWDRALQAYAISGQEPAWRVCDGMDPRPIGGEAPAKDQPQPARFLDLDGSFALTPQQQAWVFPATTGFGVNVKRIPAKGPTHAELWPASYDQPDLTVEQLPWKRTDIDLDPVAVVVAGQTVLLAGGLPFGGAFTSGEVRAYALATGAEVGRWPLPGPPSFDAMAVAHGRVLVALRDGRIACLAPPR